MKATHFMTLFSAVALLFASHTNAQDSTKTAAKKQISNSSEQADRQQGKKLQQQSLSNDFEKSASVDTAVPVKKNAFKKHPRRTH